MLLVCVFVPFLSEETPKPTNVLKTLPEKNSQLRQRIKQVLEYRAALVAKQSKLAQLGDSREDYSQALHSQRKRPEVVVEQAEAESPRLRHQTLIAVSTESPKYYYHRTPKMVAQSCERYRTLPQQTTHHHLLASDPSVTHMGL